MCLVGSEDLVNPSAELGDTGVDSGGAGRAPAASPGHDTHQSPGVVPLADQGTTGVSLKTQQTHAVRTHRSV